LKSGLHGLVLLQRVEVLEEEQPRGLLRVIELARGAGVLVEDIVDVLERLLEDWCPCLSSSRAAAASSPPAGVEFRIRGARW
jgi:hypothetical protein